MKHFYFFILFLLFIPFASAISVTPAKQTIDFVPGGTQTFTFQVRNNAGTPLDARIGLSGDMAEYATLSTNRLSLDLNNWVPFTVTLKMPLIADKPGKNILRVTIVEDVPGSSGMVSRTAVIPWVVVNVPYPGIYGEIGSFGLANSKPGINEGEMTNVQFHIRSRGTEAITDGNAVILLTETNGTVIDRKVISNIFIDAESDYKHTLSFDTTTLSPSYYKLRLSFTYTDHEGEIVVRNKSFNYIVGTFNVTLADYEKQVPQGGIVPFRLYVTSLWRGPSYVEATLNVPGQKASTTPRIRLGEFGNEHLFAYIDTSLLPLGNVSAEVTLRYGSDNEYHANYYDIVFEVIESDEVLPTAEEPAGFKLNSLYIIIIVLIVLLMINFFVLARVWGKKKKK